ncbi:MAG: DUF2993 domain-containing protein [Cyanobium sp.]
MGEGPRSDSDPAGGGGPVLALLARGLELWLRQQCEAIEDLQIQLEGSTVQLLRGRLAGVRLNARNVIFQRLEIERVELRSEPLQVRMGTLLRSQAFQLEQPFGITGTVVFSADGLSRCLSTPPWSDLGDALAEELLGLAPLAGLRFEGERLILRSQPVNKGQPMERSTRLLIEAGGLVLRAEPDGVDAFPRLAHLPQDANIRFEEAEVGGGLLELRGRARVSA